MVAISEKTLAQITFSIEYNGSQATHVDRVHGPKVNFWRDEFPSKMLHELMGREPGESIEFTLSQRKVGGSYDPSREESIPMSRFRRQRVGGELLVPRFGRFYPQGLVTGLSGVCRDTMTPFRCTGVEDDAFIMNTNHPLVEVGRDIVYRAEVEDVWIKEIDGGGRLNDWLERLCHDGQGMQLRFRDRPTAFLAGEPFRRQDDQPDNLFYKDARMVDHVDAACAGRLKAFYGRMLEPGLDILDLMASHDSHLPDDLATGRVTGLGLNSDELAANPALHERIVHDLNETPELPFDDDSFGAVICSLSMEYLSDPVAVLKEAARVLQPGGTLYITFSNRWFPTKAIHIWPQLHEFERMAFVLDLMERAEGFSDLKTMSERGWARAYDDPHFPALREMDPLYAVWGRVSKAVK